MNGANLLAIGAMAVATFGCRAGGYWVFSRLPPSAFLRSVMSYLPGALFVAFVVPALEPDRMSSTAPAAAPTPAVTKPAVDTPAQVFASRMSRCISGGQT